MAKRQRIRKRVWTSVSPADMTALVQDVQRALDSVPDQSIIVTEPQHLALPMMLDVQDDRPPRLVTLARVVNAASPETPVSFGNVTWDFLNGQVRIHDVGIMSPGSMRYSFTFEVKW